MERATPPEGRYSFADFTLDVAAERLLRGLQEIKLRPKSFHVLRYLVEHPGRVVSRDELMQEVWGDIAVSDESLTKCIADVRKALADDAQQIVRTVTRRGFLFQAEVRPGAENPELPVASVTPPPPPRKARRRILVASVAAFLVIAGLAALRWGGPLLRRRPTFEAIAVLPFEALSSGPDQQYLADGITEAIITDLGQSSPLRVIARTSVNQYQKTRKTIAEIARELKVDLIVEGTITQLNDRIRVTANLIQVSPEKHIWARSYERKFSDLLSIQDEVALAIAREIRGNVSAGVEARNAGKRSANLDAQIARWKARYFIHHRRTPESAARSLEFSQQAVRLDPDSAEAHASLALSYVMCSYMGVPVPGGAGGPAKAAAQRALSLDPNLGEAHDAMGQVLFLYDRDVPASERSFRRAIEFNPSDADARMNLAGSLAALGRADEAVIEIRRARELDPFSFLINREVGRMLYYSRRYDEALVELRQAAQMQPGSSAVDWWIVRCLWQKGLVDQAVTADLNMRTSRDKLTEHVVADLKAAYANGGSRGYWSRLKDVMLPIYAPVGGSRAHLIDISLRLGDKDEAFRWLEQSLSMWARVEPEFDPVRTDPRFPGILRRYGLER